MNESIRVGLAGFGMSGKIFHAPFIHADSRYRLVKCYERATDRCRAEYPYVETVREFEELLTDDIDLVVIALPNKLHYNLAKRALEAGKHILVEKPVTATEAEARELCALAKEKGVVFAVNQNRRFDGDFLTARSLIESGKLGRIVDYRARYDRFLKGVNQKPWKAAGGRGVDILYDLGVHVIDQAYALFGMPESVYAELRTLRPESNGCDAFDVSLYYPNQLTATLSGTETSALPGAHYTVNGELGSFVKYGMDPQEAALLAGERPPKENWGKDLPESYGSLRLYENGTLTDSRVETIAGNYANIYDRLYSAITEGAEPSTSGEQAAEVIRILEKAQESARTGKRVSLK